MSNRVIGQFLLWVGFISAAVGAVANLEYDLVSENEKGIIGKLDAGFKLPENTVDSLSESGLAELSEADLAKVVDAANRAFADYDPETAAEGDKAKPSVNRETFFKARSMSLENRWPTVRWVWYGCSMVIGIVGVVLLRSSARSRASDSDRIQQHYSEVTSSMNGLLASVSELNAGLDQRTPAEIVHYIDDRCAADFARFAEARHSLSQRFGLQAYADIMTEFASSERFINRTWSAAADGYINEARDCVARAESHLKQASRLLNEHESRHHGNGEPAATD